MIAQPALYFQSSDLVDMIQLMQTDFSAPVTQVSANDHIPKSPQGSKYHGQGNWDFRMLLSKP